MWARLLKGKQNITNYVGGREMWETGTLGTGKNVKKIPYRVHPGGSVA